jgi:cytochrome P450
MLTDLRALSHVLKRTDVYQKEEAFARSIIQLMGKGVLAAEDEPHRLQRKVLNPAFGPLQLREQTGVFLDKANEVHD